MPKVKWLLAQLAGLAVGWLSPVVFGMVTIILTVLHKVPVWEIFIAVVVVVSCSLLAINQIPMLLEKNRKKISKYSDKEIENTIRDWVNIPTLRYQCQEPSSEVLFQFTVVDDVGRPINLIREKRDPSIIHLVAEMILPAPRILSPQDWNRIAGELSLEMARLGIEFLFNGEHGNKFERIRLMDPVVLDDSLTVPHFRQRVMFVIRGMVLVQEVFKTTLRELAPNEPNPHKEGSQT